MGEYERLVSKIEEYKEKEDIVETDEVISALDLYNIVNNRFAKLRDIIAGKELKNKINRDNKGFIQFERNINGINTCLNYECNYIVPSISANKTTINFYFSKGKVVLSKDIGGTEVNFASYVKKDILFLNNYYYDIMNLFQILEQYQRLLYDSEKKIENQRNIILKIDSFDIVISCNERGIITCNIVDRENGKLLNIADISRNVILSKIPVKKSNLPTMFKQILDERKTTDVKKIIRKY